MTRKPGRYGLSGLLSCAASASALLACGTAWAADPQTQAQASTDTLIVTARQITEDVQTVPVSDTVLKGGALAQLGINDPHDLQFQAPSLTISGINGHTRTSYAIRGLGRGVTTYWSQAPGGPTAAGTPFFDISSVQVLAGPQGTLFGRTSAAGAILIEPNRPVLGDSFGSVDVTGGDYGRIESTFVGNIPLVSDVLGVRIAAQQEKIDGYTRLIGSNERLDETNNFAVRLGVEYRKGRVEDYSVFDFQDVDQTSAAQILARANLGLATLNLPPAAGPAVFGAACATAVSIGLSPSVANCIAQRLGTLSNIKATLAAEQARIQSGGSVRQTPASLDLPPEDHFRHFDFINVADVDLGDLGFSHVSIRNILAIQGDTNFSQLTLDGVGGVVEQAAAGIGQVANTTASIQQFGNSATGSLGPFQMNYSEELQIHGDFNDKLILWTLGGFAQYVPGVVNTDGVGNLFRLYDGVLQPNLGYSVGVAFPHGGYTRSYAVYTHAIADLSRFGLHGLRLSAGIRATWDATSSTFLAPVINFQSGVITPGATKTTATKSDGLNWLVSLDEQVNPNLLLYVTSRRSYVPGGVNVIVGASAAPNYQPTFAPETVTDVEVGLKSDFNIGGVRARLNLAAYRDWYENIQQSFAIVIGTNNVTYTANAASAILQGIEVEGTVWLTDGLDISANYSYSGAKYVSWFAQDPFNIAKVGNPLCVAGSPPGQCYIDLHNNSFPNNPQNKATVDLTYRVPISESMGELSSTIGVYYQSRMYLATTPQRFLQLLPDGLDVISQKAFSTVHLRVDWRHIAGSRWRAAAFVDNLTDATYALSGAQQYFNVGVATKIYEPPRRFGIQVGYEFGGQ